MAQRNIYHLFTAPDLVGLRDTTATAAADDTVLPRKLLGVHSASLDMSGRDRVQDETLGLNCAWYADMLMVLSEDV